MRSASINRKTKETSIDLKINLDGNGKSEIDTGIGFLDHMLTLFSFHSGFDIDIKANSDLYVDDHHCVEDIALVLGKAFKEALGDKVGIKRYSSVHIPMDESLSLIALDISGRAYLVYDVDFDNNCLGNIQTQNFKEFFKSFVNESKITLHIKLLYGENDHHKIESVFKGFGKALKEASLVIDDKINSSKGVL